MYERKKNKHAHTKHKTNSHIKLINHLPRAQLYFVYCMYECDFINFDLIVFLCPSFSSFFPLILYAIFSRQKTIICPSCAPQSSNRTLHTSIVVVIRARTHAYIYTHKYTHTLSLACGKQNNNDTNNNSSKFGIQSILLDAHTMVKNHLTICCYGSSLACSTNLFLLHLNFFPLSLCLSVSSLFVIPFSITKYKTNADDSIVKYNSSS